MKRLLFTGKVTSPDKEPLIHREEIEISENRIKFKNYPLSMLEINLTSDGITIDDINYPWQAFPVKINKSGKHATVYRDIVEENITITIEFKSDNTEGKL